MLSESLKSADFWSTWCGSRVRRTDAFKCTSSFWRKGSPSRTSTKIWERSVLFYDLIWLYTHLFRVTDVNAEPVVNITPVLRSSLKKKMLQLQSKRPSTSISAIPTPFIQPKAHSFGRLCISWAGDSPSEKLDFEFHVTSHLSPHGSSLQQHTGTSPAVYTTNLCCMFTWKTLTESWGSVNKGNIYELLNCILKLPDDIFINSVSRV